MIGSKGFKLIRLKKGLISKLFCNNRAIIMSNKNSNLLMLKRDFFLEFLKISKMKFWGRGYKIILRKDKTILLFNKAHSSTLYSKRLGVKFSKTKFIELGWPLNFRSPLEIIKPLNIYKKYGLFNFRKLRLKKRGKNIAN